MAPGAISDSPRASVQPVHQSAAMPHDPAANGDEVAQVPGFQRHGLWFDDFELGRVVRSGARTVTEADLVGFAGLSGDFTRLHTDREYCARTPFRRPIAHGLLVQSIATGLGIQSGVFEGTLQALSGMTIHWRAPVFPGDTIRLELEVAQLDPEPKRRSGAVVFDARVYNQEDRLVCEGQWYTRMLRHRPELPAEGPR